MNTHSRMTPDSPMLIQLNLNISNIKHVKYFKRLLIIFEKCPIINLGEQGKDAFDISLFKTNLSRCYLRSWSWPLSWPPSWSWLPSWPPSLDTNKWPSSDQWKHSFAFIWEINPVTLLDSASHCRGVVELSGLIAIVFFTWSLWRCCGLLCNRSTSPHHYPDASLVQGDIEWHSYLEYFHLKSNSKNLKHWHQNLSHI